MLPDKKKKLIISIISIILIIALVFGLYKLSNFIKDKSSETGDYRANDKYSEKFNYYGIMQDKDGIYKVFGINDTEEVYLGLKSFYEIQDILVKDNHLIMYSDAVNEVRYEKKKDEYYFYELDSYYSKNDRLHLAKDYLIRVNDKTLDYWKYEDSENKKSIEYPGEFLISENKIYYLKDEGIYEYNLDSSNETLIYMYYFGELKLINVCNNYLYYLKDNSLICYDLKNKTEIIISDYIDEKVEFLDGLQNEFLYLIKDETGNTLKKFNLDKREINNYQYPLFNEEINKFNKVNDKLYYFNLSDNSEKRNVLIDIDSKDIVKELENEYLYIVEVTK